MSRALDGKRVDISLFNADPFPLLSVQVGIRSSFLRACDRHLERILSAMMTARASRDDINSDAFSFLSKTQGNSAFVIS